MRADWLRTVFVFNKYIPCCSASSQATADFAKEKKALKTTRIITVAFMSSYAVYVYFVLDRPF